MITIAPPGATVNVSDNAPHVLTYCFNTSYGLTPAGVTAVASAAAAYLTGTKIAALGAEQFRNGGNTVVPAAIIGAKSGSFPVLNVDAITQSAALVTLIATAGNAG